MFFNCFYADLAHTGRANCHFSLNKVMEYLIPVLISALKQNLMSRDDTQLWGCEKYKLNKLNEQK